MTQSDRKTLPKPSDVINFPIDADMQWGTKKGRPFIRVFYRYRGNNVPEPIAAEMRKKLAERAKQGKKGTFEIRRYIGEVVENVFYPTPAFKSKPSLFPRPIKTLKGRRASKIAALIDARFSSQHARLTNPDGAYSLAAGATGLLVGIAHEEGITEDLFAALCDVFPREKAEQFYSQLLSASLFMSATGEAAWHIEHWSARRVVPAKMLPSQVTKLFEEIGQVEGELRAALAKRRFARHKRVAGDLYALDGTNSPCNARKIGLAHIGKGKSGVLQRQVVLSYLYSAHTGLPITYQAYAGNMADVASLSIFKDLWKAYGIKDSEAVSMFDRSYFKIDEMTDFNRQKIPFICAVKMNLNFVQNVLPSLQEMLRRENQIDGTCVFGKVIETYMKPKCEDSKVYLHIYLSPEVLGHEMAELSSKLLKARQDWANGKALPADMKDFFKNPKEGEELVEDEEAISKAYAHMGFFAFVSNVVNNCAACLAKYGLRNGVEVCFKTAKNSTGMTTLRVHNDATLMGKVFVNFIAVMMASAVLARMRHWHIPSDNEDGECELALPLSYRTAFRKLLHEVDAVFLHKEPRCEPSLNHETEKINKYVRQLRLPKNFFEDPAKFIELMTRIPEIGAGDQSSSPAAPVTQAAPPLAPQDTASPAKVPITAKSP